MRRIQRTPVLTRVLTVLSMLAALLGGATLAATSAYAVGSYNNATIADDGLSHVGQVGGQCKTFANNMVIAASGGSQRPSGYQSGWAALGTEISSANATKGDIIQITPAGSTDATAESLYNYSNTAMRLHTAIVVTNNGGNSFTVVDSNWSTNNDQIVRQHTFNPYTWASGSIIKIWRLGAVSGGTASGGISISYPLTVSAPSGNYVNAPITETFTVRNTTGSSITLQYLLFALRDPYGANYDHACASGLTLAAGESYNCTFSNTWASVGTYTTWADWESTSGTWHQGQLGPNQTFTLAAAPALEATSPLTVSAPSGNYVNAPITETFTVKNTTGSTITAHSLLFALRDPYGANYDHACGTDVVIASGATYNCTFSNTWASVGTYTVWADWGDSNGTWHQGQLGPNQTFTLAAAPALEATSPLTLSAPSGYHVNQTVNESFTVKNTTGSDLTVQWLIFALRDPYGADYDHACASSLTLAAGATYNCTFSNTWASVGTYTVWADWEDANGTWHQGELGPNQTFTLTS